MGSTARSLVISGAAALVLAGCGGLERIVDPCPSGECVDSDLRKPLSLSHPDSVINQVEYSWENKVDIDFEEVLYEGYIYRSNSTTDSIDLVFRRSEELQTLRNILEAFETIVITFEEPERVWLEYGENAVPDSLDNVATTPNHPNEVWTVYRLIGELLFFNTDEDTGEDTGFIVRQRFDFSFRPHVVNGKTLWQHAEWNDRDALFNLKPARFSLPHANLNSLKTSSNN